MIPARPLGRSGLRAPALGFGVAGPLGAGFVAEGRVRRLIEHALAGGVRLFDTAPFYGLAEARLGRALGGIARADVTLVSKVGTRHLNGETVKDFSVAGVRASLHASLEALRTDHLDILLLHGPPPTVAPELLEALRELLTARMVRAVGVCGRGDELRLAASDPLFSVIQAPVHSPWPAWAKAQELGVLGIEALSGARRPQWSPPTVGDLWRLGRRLSMAGESEAPAPNPADAAALLRRALATEGVSVVVTTTTRPRRLAENLRTAAASPA